MDFRSGQVLRGEWQSSSLHNELRLLVSLVRRFEDTVRTPSLPP